MSAKILYTAEATAKGGCEGHVHSDDGAVDLVLDLTEEFGGPGGRGANPGLLFAAGDAACRAAKDVRVMLGPGTPRILGAFAMISRSLVGRRLGPIPRNAAAILLAPLKPLGAGWAATLALWRRRSESSVRRRCHLPRRRSARRLTRHPTRHRHDRRQEWRRSSQPVMTERFTIGDRSAWNPEAGHVSDSVIRVHTTNVDDKGYIHDAGDDARLHQEPAPRLFGRTHPVDVVLL